MGVVIGMVKSMLIGWGSKLLTAAALEWLVLWAGEMLVKSTKTPHDDEFFYKLKELISGKKKD